MGGTWKVAGLSGKGMDSSVSRWKDIVLGFRSPREQVRGSLNGTGEFAHPHPPHPGPRVRTSPRGQNRCLHRKPDDPSC